MSKKGKRMATTSLTPSEPVKFCIPTAIAMLDDNERAKLREEGVHDWMSLKVEHDRGAKQLLGTTLSSRPLDTASEPDTQNSTQRPKVQTSCRAGRGKVIVDVSEDSEGEVGTESLRNAAKTTIASFPNLEARCDAHTRWIREEVRTAEATIRNDNDLHLLAINRKRVERELRASRKAIKEQFLTSALATLESLQAIFGPGYVNMPPSPSPELQQLQDMRYGKPVRLIDASQVLLREHGRAFAEACALKLLTTNTPLPTGVFRLENPTKELDLELVHGVFRFQSALDRALPSH